jgi:hypothetical protein
MSEKGQESDRVEESEANQLYKLLQAQAKALQDEAVRSGGQVPAERLEALRRLSGLVEICDAARPRPSRSRWPLIAAFACTLLIASILLFARPKSTRVEMDLRVDEMSFVLANRQVLSQQLRLSALGASGLRRIQIPRARGTDASTLLSGQDFESGIALMAAAERQARGEVSLPELILPAQTRVLLKKTEAPGQYRMALQGAGLDLSANVNGPVRVNLTGGGERQLSFLSPKAMVFEPQSQHVNLDLTFPALPEKIPPAPLAVQDLSLLRIEDRRGPEGLPVREVSTILSGTIYFEELNGQELQLRSGEAIRLRSSQGEIDVLQFKDDQIVLQFHGSVQGMTAGSSEVERSMMPNWLEWLKARRGFYLLWGTAIYLYGLVVGVMRWLKVAQ